MTKRCVWCDTAVHWDETFAVGGAWLSVTDEDWYCSIAAKNGKSGHGIWEGDD